MNLFINLTPLEDGKEECEKVGLNVLFIKAFQNIEGRTKVVLNDGTEMFVKESVKDIWKKL